MERIKLSKSGILDRIGDSSGILASIVSRSAHRSIGDAALQAGNSESIVKRHYLNTHTREEGGEFFRTIPDVKRRPAVLAPEKETTLRKDIALPPAWIADYFRQIIA